ncbi:MAG: hypothetical protein HXY34_05070 [Candidatus Thorarchaeota archaeon]|nr:hypothetical protein [Candidatus Thorarchaeota archaeon]
MVAFWGLLDHDGDLARCIRSRAASFDHYCGQMQTHYVDRLPSENGILCVRSGSGHGPLVTVHEHETMLVYSTYELPERYAPIAELTLKSLGQVPSALPDTEGNGAHLALQVSASGIRSYATQYFMYPFYVWTLDGSTVFSSERKLLWGLPELRCIRLEPSQWLLIDSAGRKQVGSGGHTRPSVSLVSSPSEHVTALSRHLRKSFEPIRGQGCAILFSGGVDSSLLALLANQECESVSLLTTCTEDSLDGTAAERAAELLGMDFHRILLDLDLAWQMLPEVVFAIESWAMMDVAIALPFVLASKYASKRGIVHVVSGQGPDELFGGYSRHAETFLKSGPRELDNQLWCDVSVTHRVNIERDIKAINWGGCEPFFPYLAPEFVRHSMSIPSEQKIVARDGATVERKHVFRALARSLGLAESLASASKHATQYSSGSETTISAAIRRYGLEARDMTRRQMHAYQQTVLDSMATVMGLKSAPRSPARQPHFDTESMHRFLDRLSHQ